jgi:predicted outer membrane repeat protein
VFQSHLFLIFIDYCLDFLSGSRYRDFYTCQNLCSSRIVTRNLSLSINDAVAALHDGDTLDLPPGYYTGSDSCGIVIHKSNVTIRGLAGPGRTIIDCAAQARHFLILGDNVTIQGVQLQNGAAYSRDCSFMTDLGLDCEADSSGGCALVLGKRAELHDTTFTNCSAEKNGGAISAVGNLHMDKVGVHSCRAFDGGGVWSSGGLDVRNSTFVLGTAFRGGAFFLDGSNATLTADGMTLRLNRAQSSGGGIYADGAVSIHLDQDNVIAENSAGANGGGIYIAMNSVLLVRGNSKIVSNRVTDGSNAYGGGAVSAYQGCTIEIADTAAFEKNLALRAKGGSIRATHGCQISMRGNSKISKSVAGTGGAIFADQKVTINISDHVLLDENDANDYCGGAIYMGGMSSANQPLSGPGPMYLFVTGHATFKRNTAADSGGAILVSGKPPFITTSHIVLSGSVSLVENSATYDGGAIQIEYSSTLNIEGYVSFLRNLAGTTGGAISAIESFVALSGKSILVENFAYLVAGAIKLARSDMEIHDHVLFKENQAYSYGGAVAGMESSSIHLMDYARFTENSAQDGGGIFVSQGCEVHISGHVIFTANFAENGGAISLGQEVDLIVNNNAVFERNDALVQGGAIRSSGIVRMHLSGNVSFLINRAGQRGGGIHLEHDSKLHVEDDVLFMGNAARKIAWPEKVKFLSRFNMDESSSICATHGGALYVLDASVVVISGRSKVSNNSATSGGAIFARY